jgi:hypothetical protein
MIRQAVECEASKERNLGLCVAEFPAILVVWGGNHTFGTICYG